MLRYVVLLFTILCCVGTIQAMPQTEVSLTNQIERLSLAPHLDILEDPSRELSIQQVISPTYAERFLSNSQAIPNFGRTRSAYWVRFVLNNQSELKWYLKANAFLGDDVALYVLSKDGQIITDDVTRYLPNYGLHAWSLTLPKHQPLQIYIRATNGDAIFSLPLELLASDSFVEETRLNYILYASIIAALLMVAVYNLLSFFLLRESSYLVLAIHITAVAAIVQITNPVYNVLDFLGNTDSHFFTAPVYIAAVTLLMFCRQLLDTLSSVPRLDKFMRAVMVVSACLIFVTGWIPQGTFLPQSMVVIAFVLIMWAGIIQSLQGHRVAKYFLFIFVLMTLMVIPNTILNVVAETQWQSAKFYSTGMATLLFLFLLTIVQSEKVREWREQEQRLTAHKEATDNFLMTISHELRTPMHALVGIGELLKNTPLNAVQKDYLRKQDNMSQHMLGLVNDMLDIGAMSRGNHVVEPVDEVFYLQDILDGLSAILDHTAIQKGVSLTVSAESVTRLPLVGDAKHLKQVLINLLENAIKYTEQGSVILAVDCQKADHLSAMTVHFDISDTGIGVPIDKRSYLFEPFFQVSRPNQQKNGSGLGLAISYQWVKQMGGVLQLRGRSNGGTCFFFTLDFPISKDGEPKKQVAIEETIDLASLQGIRILLVDDDSLNQLIGQKLLAARGADVDVADNGSQTILRLREQPYDVVLMDLSLPDMNGNEITRIIRADKSIPDCLIIALTAHAGDNEREKCLEAGMNDFLAKPYSIEALVSIILKNFQRHS